VAEEHRLRLPQMGIARHQGIQMRFGLGDDGLLQRPQALIDVVDGFQQEQPHVGGHLVVAGATGVQLAGGIPSQFVQPALDGGVDVLVTRLHLEGAGGELGAHSLQPVDQRVTLNVADEAGVRQRSRIRHRTGDVGVVQPAVEPDRGVELLHQFVSWFLKTSTPEFHGFSYSEI